MQPFNKKRRPGEKKAGKSFSDTITSRKRWNYNLKYCLNISLADNLCSKRQFLNSSEIPANIVLKSSALKFELDLFWYLF